MFGRRYGTISKLSISTPMTKKEKEILYTLFKEEDIAETIEELCDEFVLTDETLPPHLDRNLKEIVRYKTYIAGSRGNIYGAIWTDKGLTYVAKMNDKGELELI